MSPSLTPNVVGLMPDIDIQEVYQLTMMGIVIVQGTEVKRFQVPQALICSLSAYFHRATTNLNFIEAISKLVVIEHDVPIWGFITFLHWMYTRRLVLTATQLTSIEQLLGHGNAADPSTWPYKTLFLLYAMADRLDILLLRRIILEQVQIKLNTFQPQSPLPSHADLLLLQQTSLDSSPLRRYVHFKIASLPNHMTIRAEYTSLFETAAAAAATGGSQPEPLEEFRSGHGYATQQRAAQVGCFKCGLDACLAERKIACERHHRLEASDVRLTREAWCLFHEHADEAEFALCAARLSCIAFKFKGPACPAWIGRAVE